MSWRNLLEKLVDYSGYEEKQKEESEKERRQEERIKNIEYICKAECANCENWDAQKQCTACDIFKALSSIKKR